MVEKTINRVGEVLKERRQEINLSLKEVENMTSIRMTHLKAIEDGDINQVIAPVYAQGFVRQYASFLGLDGDLIVKENSDMFATPEKQEFSYGIGTLEVRSTGGGGGRWLPNALWVSVSAGILILAWAFAKYLDLF